MITIYSIFLSNWCGIFNDENWDHNSQKGEIYLKTFDRERM